MSYTRQDVVNQCDLALVCRNKANEALYDSKDEDGAGWRGTAPDWPELWISYYDAHNIWISWCNVLAAIDQDGLDPTIAVLRREVTGQATFMNC